MTDFDEAIEKASRLPLNDAAFALWIQRHRLNQIEAPISRPKPRTVDLNAPGVLERTVREAFAKVRHDIATAHDGPTFDRLKRAHPESRDEDLKRAIKTAVKLEQDCTRHYETCGEVRQAVELAKTDNPDFTEETYRSAFFDLARAMR